MYRLKLALTSFCAFFAISFGGGITLYSLLTSITKWLLGQPLVFGMLYRMFLYHYRHPFQYIAIVAFNYALLATFWSIFFVTFNGWKKWLSLTALFLLVMIISSIEGGILWKYHDMQAGYFPQGIRIVRDLAWGAEMGLLLGPIIVLLSIPLNLLTLIAGYYFTPKIALWVNTFSWGKILY